MIQLGVGAKELPHIQRLNTAKECWDTLTDIFIGNESMRRNIYDALSNQAEGFYMLDGEDHEDMYRRLKAVATTFRDLGASHVDDAWIKRKYVSALMPFEPTDLKSLQGRHNYHLMTSNEVMKRWLLSRLLPRMLKMLELVPLGCTKVETCFEGQGDGR